MWDYAGILRTNKRLTRAPHFGSTQTLDALLERGLRLQGLGTAAE